MEREIKIAAKMYNCRDTAKTLYRDKYPAKMEEYGNLIKAAMIKHNIKDEIQASMKLMEPLKNVPDSGIVIMLITAACVELIEPSK